MLGDHPVDVMLLGTDLDEARRFYGETLGLEEVLSEPGQVVAYRSPIDAGFGLVAFFTDPAGNALGLLQLTGR